MILHLTKNLEFIHDGHRYFFEEGDHDIAEPIAEHITATHPTHLEESKKEAPEEGKSDTKKDQPKG